MKKIFTLFVILALSSSSSHAQAVDFHLQDSLSAMELCDIIKGSGIATIFNTKKGRGDATCFGSFNTYGVSNDFNMNKGIILSNRPVKPGYYPPYSGPSDVFWGLGDTCFSTSVVEPWCPNPPLEDEESLPEYDSFLLDYYGMVFPHPPFGDYSMTAKKFINWSRTALHFDFVPTGDTIFLKYIVVAGESGCADFGPHLLTAFLSGPGIDTPYNIARVPGTNTIVCQNSICPDLGMPMNLVCQFIDTLAPYSEYAIDNGRVLFSDHVAYPFFTTPLIMTYPVQPCDTYHLEITMHGSNSYSGFAIEAGSFGSNGKHQSCNDDSSTVIYPYTLEQDFCVVYPNPFIDKVQISLSGNAQVSENYHVQIINMLGIKVYEFQGSLRAINQSLLNIDKSWQQGLYLMTVTDVNNHRQQTFKLLKKAS